MPNQVLRMFFFLSLGMIVAGCATVKAKTYVEDKERVDQELTGNAGYLRGDVPYGEEQAPVKKTRKVYVLELTKEKPAEKDSTDLLPLVIPEAKSPREAPSDESFETSESESSSAWSAAAQPQTNFNRPVGVQSDPAHSDPASSVHSALPIQYTVSKDDTLQTISKKFYSSYSKWPKIYEANKDKISDPNRIKPGVILTIPAIEGLK